MTAESDGKGEEPKGGAKAASSAPASSTSPMFERPSRREMIKRVGVAAGVLGASAALGRAVWDQGGFGAASSSAARQVRDYRTRERPEADVAQLAIAKQKQGEPDPSA